MNQTKCQNETSLLLVIDDNANRQILGYNIFVVTWIRSLSENEKWMWVLVKVVDYYYVKVINRDKSCGRMSEQQLNYAPFWRKSCLLAVGLLMGNIKTSETSLITNRMLSLNILWSACNKKIVYSWDLFWNLHWRIILYANTVSSYKSFTHLFQQRISCLPIGAVSFRQTGSLMPFTVTLKKRQTPLIYPHSSGCVCECLCASVSHSLQDLVLTWLWLHHSWGFLGRLQAFLVALWHEVGCVDTNIFPGQMCRRTISLHKHNNRIKG